jgi:hypothetical protein
MDQIKLARKREIQNAYYERKRSDPAFKAQKQQLNRAYYAANKENPEYQERRAKWNEIIACAYCLKQMRHGNIYRHQHKHHGV